MTRVAVLTDRAIGGTFLSWSLHWLSGQTQYYHAKYLNTVNNRYISLTQNPLTDLNSHNFVANQPNSFNDLDYILTSLPQDNNLQHVYFHQLSDNNYKFEPANNHHNYTTQAIDVVKSQFTKIIVVTKPTEYTLYDSGYVVRNHQRYSMDGKRTLTGNEEIFKDFVNTFFSQDLAVWQQQNLTDIWDQREFLALNLKPFENNSIKNCHAFDFDFFELPAQAAWLCLDQYIADIFSYIGIEIDHNRLAHWQQIYNQWKTLHQAKIKFCWHFDQIIDNVIAGRDMDLTTFNLDIVQESAIQHALIFQHNLNLKTWQLEKFINTRQLHSLLEPNIHPLSS